MCEQCKRLSLKVESLENAVSTLELRLKDITGGTTVPFQGINLSPTELKFVNFLAHSPGYANREAICSAIYTEPYGDDMVESNTVAVMVCHMRPKLASVGIEIENKFGLGYFIGAAGKAKLKSLRCPIA